ncbi:hypothetical protein DJ568_13325 [Mucilaginibacter hurinus]|uniref:GYF domain-containing protein n=1 Tax=Mucilaginibacter hurinus TaxID=2201324 RepID=A0A367GLA8_9SPHI|nr:DUF4339 domain-containing protein [Mucilaginibacter hurinus]RCH54272.1 hypothetical protein DJ568_13325 [Mucilaginibacter hurinus]
MINVYYTLNINEKSGPYTHAQLMDMNITTDTFIMSPLNENWQRAAELPEFYIYFETQGIYIPTRTNVASFWWRLLAYLIDYVLLIIFMAIIGEY